MIRQLRIENFKSIQKLEMDLGRINVFIGENGCGKSNILEAIAFAAASSQDKLANEFLAARGIRVTEPKFMLAAFATEGNHNAVKIRIETRKTEVFTSNIEWDELFNPPGWLDFELHRLKAARDLEFYEALRTLEKGFILGQLDEAMYHLSTEQAHLKRSQALRWIFDFLIYSPENSALRIFQAEGQILPLGIRGEGLFAYLKNLNASAHRHVLDEITQHLSLIDWFDRFDVPADLAPFERSIAIVDRYLTDGSRFDQRSANEGFLYLLFYFTLFIGPGTPKIFAIDNVDASLNPKLCTRLMKQLVALAEKHDKQVIFTTHNPAVLDGLDLHNDEQRLFVISRNQDGHTKARRVAPPKPLGDDLPVKLSEAFLRGALGGLPKNF